MCMDRFLSDTAYNLFVKAKHPAHLFNEAGLFETIKLSCVRGNSSSWVCFLFMSSVSLLSTNTPQQVLPLPSGRGVICMKEGIQIYYNDQLGGRSPKGSDAIGDSVEDINK